MKFRWPTLGALASIAVILPGTSLALEQLTREQPIAAKELFEGTVVSFEPGGKYQNVTLIVTGPRNYQAEVFSKSGLPSIPLEKFGKLVDGVFNYQLTAGTFEEIEIINPGLNNGRDDSRRTNTVGAQLSGRFCIKDGVIVALKDIPEEGGNRE